MNRKAAKQYVLLHVILAAAALLFPVYVRLAEGISAGLPTCFLHDFLFLYCPLCGGTRAVSALLRFDFPAALRYNAFVVALIAAALIYDAVALVRLLRGKERLWRVPGWLWIAAVAVMVVFGIVRNVLMIGWGIDPLGDLSIIWNRI